jgi:hypothetical protein
MKLKLLLATFALLSIPQAPAVKVDLPMEAEQKSTHILTGKIATIYSKTTRTATHETIQNVAQVQVQNVEKGEGLKNGETLYVRYVSKQQWIGKGPGEPGAGPHEHCPSEGQTLRMCLVRNADQSFDVYYVSGFKP